MPSTSPPGVSPLPCPTLTCSYDAKTDLLHPSRVEFPKPPPLRTRIILEILEFLRLVRLERLPSAKDQGSASPRNGTIISSTNLTILNFLLVTFGPLQEQSLCVLMGLVQIACSAFAFWIRYGLGSWVYGGDRR
jgi:UDP-N-acetylglucosamine--dolichyl-phosphate N-acetylglucosaminephosphotransferase